MKKKIFYGKVSIVNSENFEFFSVVDLIFIEGPKNENPLQKLYIWSLNLENFGGKVVILLLFLLLHTDLTNKEILELF